MIISFSVSNFRSFLNEETFSLVAADRKTGAHDSHAVKVPGSSERVLRAATIYGANGAGKSNLFQAMRFFRTRALLMRKKNSGTARVAFAFDSGQDKLSTFDLLFVASNKTYRYGFKLDDVRISEEWLVQISGKREKIIFERITDEKGEITIDGPVIKKKKIGALATIGGKPNQTFLATVNRTLDDEDFGPDLSNVINWFKNDLVLISPNDAYQGLGHRSLQDPNFLEFAGSYLQAASTGVDKLDVEKQELSEEEVAEILPKEDLARMLEEADNREDGTAVLLLGVGKELVVEKKPDNHYYRIAIKTRHEQGAKNAGCLNLSQESDGTRRLLDLLPALHDLKTCNAVYFIDEIDRSMHPILVWRFLDFFLKTCEGGQRQIIVTTHESNLLDLDLLRRDEIWFAEKDSQGATRLYSLADFRVRKDLEVRKHYLQGRFGAIPFLGNLDRLLETNNSHCEQCP